MAALRWFAVARAGYGLGLLCAPGLAAGLAGSLPSDTRFRGVARVLGARHCAQALVTVCRPSPDALLLGAGIDILHAASMLALAASRRRRRAGLTDAAAATAFAAAGLVIACFPPRDEAATHRRASSTGGPPGHAAG